MAETGKSVYVKVVDEQALSKVVVVRIEDGGGLGSEPTHQFVQSGNRQFERVNVKFEDKDKALMLLNSLPTSPTYENLITTLTWGKGAWS